MKGDRALGHSNVYNAKRGIFSSVIDGVGALDSESFEISRLLHCLQLLQLPIETMGAISSPLRIISMRRGLPYSYRYESGDSLAMPLMVVTSWTFRPLSLYRTY